MTEVNFDNGFMTQIYDTFFDETKFKAPSERRSAVINFNYYGFASRTLDKR